MQNDETLILTGPTGIGKTELSLQLAARLNAEIISADSRTVYRGLDTGTAKPTAAERTGVPHHLIDVRDPGERFTAADFRDGCMEVIVKIRAGGRAPLIVGGTCMYLHALLHGFDFGGADRDPEFRARIEERARSEGSEALHRELSRLAPEAAERIPATDARRIIRALELIHLTGAPTPRQERMNDNDASRFPICGSDPQNPKSKIKNRPLFPARVFILCLPREILYDRINKRVDGMYNKDIIEETEGLLRRHGPGIREFLKGIIGYSQAVDLLEGKTGRGEAVEATRRETRRFAKRQMTWFRSMGPAVWLNTDGHRREGLLPLIEQYINSGPQY